jgi:hypothetical protein
MQEALRSMPDDFPGRQRYIDAYEQGDSHRAAEVAAAMLDLAGRDPSVINGKTLGFEDL